MIFELEEREKSGNISDLDWVRVTKSKPMKDRHLAVITFDKGDILRLQTYTWK